jgi:hypothetical protein
MHEIDTQISKLRKWVVHHIITFASKILSEASSFCIFASNFSSRCSHERENLLRKQTVLVMK